MTPAVRLTSITKRYGKLTALDAVDLSVAPGTIHAIVGENGAGKTTLMRALYGAMQPDSGQIAIDGTEVRFGDSSAAIAAGIGMVSQHYGIVPGLSCLQNLILGAEGGAILHPGAARVRAEALAQRMGFRFDWEADAGELTPAAAQKLEILKLLWRNSKIMILDEPTAMLSPADGVALFSSLRQVVSEGATVLLVTHRLPEVLDYCQNVTVLRGGKRVAERPVAGTTAVELTRLIVGESDFDLTSAPVLPSVGIGGAALQVRGLMVRDERRHEALRDANLTVAAGEVVGVAGVDGNGQRELFLAIAGLAHPSAGEVRVFGEADTGVAARLRQGVRWIPEDRHHEAIVGEWSLTWNAVLGRQRSSVFPTKVRVAWAERVAAKFGTRHGGLNQPIRSLSGGNQQRFVAARVLESDPRLLLAFQPARGLDLKGTRGVYAEIRSRCAAGMAALVVSFDLDELLTHCDRIVVLNGGRLREPTSRQREAIGQLMVSDD